ncbi:MAG TPA: DUF2169 domain-containing protein [Byssovorax sp.]|jgi:hypothetical protein
MANPLVEIAPLGPIQAASAGFSQRGGTHLTLVVKATFSLVHDGVAELVDPEPVHAAEVHQKNNPTRSIRAASDLAPYQRRADVMFVGHAYAPGGQPTPAVRARLLVLRDATPLVDKTLVIEGDAGDGGPLPFERMPIVYERAFGGAGWADNPLGVGATEGSARPNVIDPRDPSRSAGFAPISRAWPARRRLLGAADRKKLELPIAELPDSFDWSYFQSAPLDQQTEFLRGDERIVLEGVHPTLPRLETRLPSTRAAARVFGLAGAASRPLALQLDTLLIDGDAMTCSAVYRAIIPVAGPEAFGALRVVAGLEVLGLAQQVLAFDAAGNFTAMPWPATAEEVFAARARAPEPSLADSIARARVANNSDTMALESSPPPFAGEAAPLVAAAPSTGVALPKFGVTRTLSDEEAELAAHRPVSPFIRPAVRAPAAVAPHIAAPAIVMAPPIVAPHIVAPPIVAPPIAPPPAVGVAVHAGAPPSSSSSSKHAGARDAASVGVEECAAVAAELALGREARAGVLKARSLDEATWRKAERRHNDAMDADSEAAPALRVAYDSAFVDAVELIRGVLTPASYAELLLATERGDLAGALASTGLTRATWLRVQRVLKRRSANDPSYGKATERALTELRSRS